SSDGGANTGEVMARYGLRVLPDRAPHGATRPYQTRCGSTERMAGARGGATGRRSVAAARAAALPPSFRSRGPVGSRTRDLARAGARLAGATSAEIYIGLCLRISRAVSAATLSPLASSSRAIRSRSAGFLSCDSL